LKITHAIDCVDTHTAGEPTRIIQGGVPILKGDSIIEKRNWFKDHCDKIRTGLTFEPRGHAGMLCAAIVPPVSENADVGVFYFDDAQYLDMCGHATIGVGTALAELGLVPKEKKHKFVLETPAGLVTVKNSYKDGIVEKTTIVNVPSYVVESDLAIEMDGIGKIKVDIAYGGNTFAIVSADKFNLRLLPENIVQIKHLSKIVKNTVNQRLEKRGVHVHLVQWYHDALGTNADLRCVHSSGIGSPDRSPGGTGTSAKLALLHRQGKLKENEPFVQEGIVGGKFTGEIIGLTEIAGEKCIIPQITGKAYITGFHKFVFDKRDELHKGFFIE